jgi:hypothetical protein
MKKLLFVFLSFITLGLLSAQAQDDGTLPFPVSLGGQAATAAKGTPFAKVAKAVKSDAAIEVGAKDQMIIINVSKTDEKGQPAPGASPAVILLQGTNKGTLAGTMDKSKLAPGNYLLSVVAGGKTASIQFKVE